MPRSKNGTRRRERRHKILTQAKGYWGGRSRLFKTAKESVMKALASSYRDRKRRKGDFRIPAQTSPAPATRAASTISMAS